MNSDETTPKIELTVKEVETVIAAGLHANHNETVGFSLTVEECEVIIVPGIHVNHNETVVVPSRHEKNSFPMMNSSLFSRLSE